MAFYSLRFTKFAVIPVSLDFCSIRSFFNLYCSLGLSWLRFIVLIAVRIPYRTIRRLLYSDLYSLSSNEAVLLKWSNCFLGAVTSEFSPHQLLQSDPAEGTSITTAASARKLALPLSAFPLNSNDSHGSSTRNLLLPEQLPTRARRRPSGHLERR